MRKLLQKTLLLILPLFIIIQTGCGSNLPVMDDNIASQEQQPAAQQYLPVKKADGSKFKIAYVDINPYNVIFKELFYLVESLKTNGWLSYEYLPFDPEIDSDSQALINWLAENAESEYLTFDKTANYYTSTTSNEEIYKSLKQHIEVNKDIDLILAMGTSVSAMLQDFGFDIPLLMYGVADPVGSGLIASAEDSGNDNYWAHIDKEAYIRQMQYYYNILEFKNLGAVYGNEIVAAMPDYRMVAKANGFKITEYQLDKDSFEDENEYYTLLIELYKKLINEDKIDAYIFNTNVITDVDKAVELMQMFFDADIPVFAQIGTVYVLEGAALLMVNTHDAVGTAPFVANIIGSVLNGAKAGELEQEYESSPYLILNLDVAEKIGFEPSFEMLVASEKVIYTGREA